VLAELPGASQRPDFAPWLADYVFLGDAPETIAALRNNELLRLQWGVPFVVALLAGGGVSQDGYTRALAAFCDVPCADASLFLKPSQAARATHRETDASSSPLFVEWRGVLAWLIVATHAEPPAIHQQIARARAGGGVPLLISGRAFDQAIERARAPSLVKAAAFGLKRQLPGFSAARAGPQWQRNACAVVIGFIAGGLVAYPPGMLALVMVLLTLPFVGTVFVRVVALAGLFRAPEHRVAPREERDDRDLPVYSILVALFDEARVLPDLIASLSRLDYPLAKLDCLLVIEDVDSATKAALLDMELPGFMRVVIVPEGAPQTKPRALNYALSLARGAYVVVYDAEDRPEPDQLRRALDAFQRYGANLACVQACLNIFNARQSWLTRQFTVEYTALFDSVLPALQWMRLPMPLGGTSNHFPRRVLEELHGWDPYNVTEDADLGIRIARLGYDVAAIPSTTWEEAPATFTLWRNQRTRWIKGWIQTYLVHTRRPLLLWRDLGFARAVGFHVYMGGLILSALVHPLFYAAVLLDLSLGLGSIGFDAYLGPLFWGIAIGNLIAGYATSIVVGIVSARRRGHQLTLSALMMPLYWLLISFAAYRALWQLYRDPYLWEKTPHGLAEEDDAAD
jgi:glycosyltransferase XagB